jgi:hypothetical protein
VTSQGRSASASEEMARAAEELQGAEKLLGLGLVRIAATRV